MVKRWIALLIVSTLILSGFTVMGFAQGASSILQKAEIEKVVREKLNIGEEYKLQHTNLHTRDINKKQIWTLDFQNERDGGSISVAALADTGEVISYSKWDQASYGRVMTVLPEEAKNTAVDFIKRLQPQRFSETEEVMPQRDVYGIYHEYYGGEIYAFTFVRKVKNEYFPNNYFRVNVSGINGTVTSYETQWDDINYSNEKPLLSEQEARKVFEQSENIVLKYIRFRTPNQEKSEFALTPVYMYIPKETDKINGITGDFLTWQDIYRWDYPYYRGGYGDAMMGLSKEAAMDYGYYEQLEVIPEEGVISKEKAEKIVQESLGKELDLEGLRLNQSFYSENRNGIPGKYWTLHWWGQEVDKSLQVILNAENSKIIGLNYVKQPKVERMVEMDVDRQMKEMKVIALKKDLENGRITKATFEKEYDRLIAELQEPAKKEANEEAIIKKVEEKIQNIDSRIKSKDMKLKLEKLMDEDIVYLTSPRYIHAIPYDENYMHITYQESTDEIIKLNYNWYDIEVPAPQGIKPLAQVQKRFYDTVGLERFLVQLKDQELLKKEGLEVPLKELLPVYGLKPIPFAYINGENGAFLNYAGEEINLEKNITRSYQDIEKSPYAKEIVLMERMGILNENKEEFNPGTILTRQDALKWIVEMGWGGRLYYINRPYYAIGTNQKEEPYFKDIDEKDPFFPYIQAAVREGILEKTGDYFYAKTPVTKMEISQWILNAMKQKKLAQYTEIFQVPYRDREEIKKENYGYAALAKFYNIFGEEGEGEIFNPKQNFTRERFVSILYHLLKENAK